MSKTRWRLSAVAVCLVAVALIGGPTAATPSGTAHYPDLATLKPSDLGIDSSSGRKLLVFSNTVWNGGNGPLELRPVNSAGQTKAYQRIYTHDAQGKWTLQSEVLVGTFTFHSAHNHWHFDNFSTYQIRNVLADGSMGGNVKRTSTKQTFCLADTTEVNSSLEHAARMSYPVSNCDQNNIQGISVGWGDKYSWYLAGQNIDVTGLPNGAYYLYSVVDKTNRIKETNNSNNGAAVKIRLRGSRVIVLG